MSKEKIVGFIKKHKVKLALGLAAGTGVAIWLITKGKDKPSNYIDIEKPELSTGKWVSLFKGIKGEYKGSITGMVNAVDVADLGKFGDALVTIEGIDEHEPIRIMFGTERSYT